MHNIVRSSCTLSDGHSFFRSSMVIFIASRTNGPYAFGGSGRTGQRPGSSGEHIVTCWSIAIPGRHLSSSSLVNAFWLAEDALLHIFPPRFVALCSKGKRCS